MGAGIGWARLGQAAKNGQSTNTSDCLLKSSINSSNGNTHQIPRKEMWSQLKFKAGNWLVCSWKYISAIQGELSWN